MKKHLMIFTIITLLTSSIYSEDAVGKGSVAGAQASQSASFQNWALIGTAIAFIAIGVYVVSIAPGRPFHAKK